MNTPAPQAAPPTLVPATASTAGAPQTFGSVLGGALGLVAVSKLGLNPLDPLTGGALVSLISGLVAYAFHWVGTKITL